MWLLPCMPAPESISSSGGTAIPSHSHLLLTQAGITWTNAHYGAVCRTCSKVTISWGKIKSETKSNSVRGVLIWSYSPRWRTSFKQAGRRGASGCSRRLTGDKTAAQAWPKSPKKTRPCRTLGSLDGSFVPMHNQSCMIWTRSFCYGQVILLTQAH